MTTTPTHNNRPDVAASRELPSICFDRWRFAIQTAKDLDQLLHIVSTYIGSWTPAQLSVLPPEISLPVLNGCDDLMARAVMVTRSEVNFTGDALHYPLLREMALTLGASASRMRYLQAVRSGRA